MTNSELNSIFKKISSLVALSSVLTFSPFKGMAVSSKLLAPPSHDKKSFQENLKAVDVPSEDIACLTEGYERVLLAEKILNNLRLFSHKNHINLNRNSVEVQMDANENLAITLYDNNRPSVPKSEKKLSYLCDKDGNMLSKESFTAQTPNKIVCGRHGEILFLDREKNAELETNIRKEKHQPIPSFVWRKLDGTRKYYYNSGMGESVTRIDKLPGQEVKNSIYPIWDDMGCAVGVRDYRIFSKDEPASIQKTEDAIQEIEPVLPPTHDINSFKINLQAVDVPSNDIPHLINGYNDFLVAQKTLTSLWAFSQKNNINLNVNCLTAEVDQNGNIAMTLFDKDNPFTEENEENRQEYYCCDAQGNKLENNPHWKNIFNNRNPHICYYRDGNVYINIPCLPERKSTSTTATALKEKKDFVSFFKTQINGDCEYEYRHRDGSEEGLTMKDKIKGEKSYPIWEDNCGGYFDFRHQGGSKPQYQKAPELIQKQRTKSLISNSSRVRD